jgi:beta-galactosidase
METDHWHKMRPENGVWITLDGAHMGVGGDDSWTPSVLPQWLLLGPAGSTSSLSLR